MCGIAGVVGGALVRDEREAVLRKMQGALAHRGPDGSGIWVSRDETAGLAHTRLAIIDPGEGGAQPMAENGHCLAFNGEIYNYRDLKSPGNAWGDTRTLLRLVASRGVEALSDLAGMFALGCVNEQAGSLTLARDTFGIKPLYYAEIPGGLLFSSEVRAILATELVHRELDAQACGSFFLSGSVAEPRTMFRSIRALPAGHALTWSSTKGVSIEKFDPPSGVGCASLREALLESVRRHLVSDVPVGLFLSGGIDSTWVAALASASGAKPTAFTLSFDEEEFSELAPARSTSESLGLEHRNVRMTGAAARELYSGFLAAQDQPGIDGFNTYLISRAVAMGGFRVALSGLGGDEAFGGYPSFLRVPQTALLARMGAFLPLSLLGNALDRQGQPGKTRRVGGWLAGARTFTNAWVLHRGLFSPGETRELLIHFGFAPSECRDLLTREDAALSMQSPLRKVAHLESSLYMRNQLLKESDCMGMANGLEIRLPLVDARLAAFIDEIPDKERFIGGKAALRTAAPELNHLLPPAGKKGFTLPLQKWLENDPHAWGFRSNQWPKKMDLRHWSRRMALVSLATYLERHY